MNRSVSALVLVAGLALAGCSARGNSASTMGGMRMDAPAPANGAATVTDARAAAKIVIKNHAYTGTLTVSPGQQVTVVNSDPVNHSLTDKRTQLFDTGTITPDGGTAAFDAPTTAGSYPFGCNFHPEMAGTLVVKAVRHTTAFASVHPVTVNYGATARLATTLTDTTAHKPVGKATVALLKRVGTSGPFRSVRTLVTDASGKLTTTVKPPVRSQYKWHVAATSTRTAASSGVLTVSVRQVVHAALTPATVTMGHRAKAYGTVAPNETGKTVVLQRLVGGHWTTLHTMATIHRQTLPNGHVAVGYVLSFIPSAAGTVTLRVFRAATHTNASGASRRLTLHVG